MNKMVTIIGLIGLYHILSIDKVSAQNIPNLQGEAAPNRIKISECIADVKEVTAWDEKATQEAAKQLCSLRKKHQKAQQKFVYAINKLNLFYKDYTNHGMNEHLPKAIDNAVNIVKSCIDFKEGFTYPHNIGLLIVPETIRISCYNLGADFVIQEIPK